jgi:hypothetical protein
MQRSGHRHIDEALVGQEGLGVCPDRRGPDGSLACLLKTGAIPGRYARAERPSFRPWRARQR